jgi:hypothetical protein
LLGVAQLGAEHYAAGESMTLGGMGPCLAVIGSTTREVFETYVEKVLAPTLSDGQVVVMDNLSSHKGRRVRQLIEGRGCELLYLPAYSRRISTPSSRRPSPRSRRCLGRPPRVVLERA